ncbi:MAG: glycosyltransferase family 2 protein [Deltaproteobacteria bacterium]|nr:glycosyltransferase family 2 protein [Deltaproteobacteria bacterium]
MKKQEYKLTIGIPTWNRKQFLASNLEHLIQESKNYPQVEILVSDNASDDGTEELCEALKKRCLQFSYYRNQKNLGANFNFQNVIQKAQGSYVWLFGDDDKIVEGSINEVLTKIEAHPDVDIFVGGCINDLTKKRLYPPFLDCDLKSNEEILGDYDAIRLAGKISTLIFKRISLEGFLVACEKVIESIRTPWPHLAWFLVVLGNGGKILFLRAPTNYYLESSRFNMLQDGKTRSKIMIEDYSLLIIQLKKDGLIEEDFFKVLTRTISKGRSGEFIKIAAYSTFLNKYFETVQAGSKTLKSLPSIKNKIQFSAFYLLPIILPVSLRKALFLAPYYTTHWPAYKGFIDYLIKVRHLLNSRNSTNRAIFNEKGL